MPETGDLGRFFFVCLFVCLGLEVVKGGCGFSFTDGSLQLFLRPNQSISLSHTDTHTHTQTESERSEYEGDDAPSRAATMRVGNMMEPC